MDLENKVILGWRFYGFRNGLLKVKLSTLSVMLAYGASAMPDCKLVKILASFSDILD